jgi:preprotein translocase subunit SecG
MQALNIFHVLVAISMVAFILLQRGPGATAGAAFGSGASGTVFGARGAGSFMSRTTWVLATLFCLVSLTMAVVVSRTSTLPETDLGVVGSPVTVEAPGIAEDGVPSMDDGTAESDLPPIGAVENSAVDAGSDLPVVDPAEGTPVDPGEPEIDASDLDGSGDSGAVDSDS